MRYMLLISSDKTEVPTAPPTAADMQDLIQAHARFGEELRTAGKLVEAHRLRPDGDASRVRVKAGHHQVTDGPFAETKEALGGFYLIECDSKQEAIEWAKKLPVRDGGFVEVRPIWVM
jgi:hypothetical protein